MELAECANILLHISDVLKMLDVDTNEVLLNGRKHDLFVKRCPIMTEKKYMKVIYAFLLFTPLQ